MKKVQQQTNNTPPVTDNVLEGQHGVNYIIKRYQKLYDKGNKHLTVGNHRM